MYEQISANKRKTVVLIVLSVLFLGAIGYAVGLLWFSGPAGLVVAGGIAIAMSVSSYLYGDRMVLAASRAREVTAEQEPRLHNVIEGLAIAAGVPKPRVYVVAENAPNAFATGRDPEHSSIAVTQGLLDIMDRVELEGVIGHEMSHVVDRDILVGTVVATLVGAAILLSEFVMRFWWFGGGGRRSGNNNNSGGGAVELVLFVVGIALLVLAPLLGQLIKLSVSRNREYLADAQGAMLTRYPPGLISALGKIRDAPHTMRGANNATAHLWLDQPSRVPGNGNTSTMEKLFSTHPPMQERIKRLQEM